MTSLQTFKHLRTQKIESLDLEVEEYRHKITGAQHIHIAADNKENVFLVALRTVPHDSRGVAHILEHTALCGSERYPVRDPFFMMIRRSLNTFMNAFTSSDWTAYPFASQNRKDFNNLLDVYLDAVFFPNLDLLDFAQEGHRLEFSEMANTDSQLEFKGVVFNEMKGAMSSATSILWHGLCKYLHPSTTYHYNSGGDPEVIPDLGYDELINFHKTHYHPANAIFMTFGDIAANEHQKVFEERTLARFEALEHSISVPLEQRYSAPLEVSEPYAVPADEDPANKTHVVLGWLLGESIDLKSAMRAHLLASVLLENSASPLQQALETSDLGRAPSPLCGLDDSQREMSFVCGLEGCREGSAGRVEELIADVLNKVVKSGAPLAHMQACLHQLELQQREISGDSQPFGLSLILASLNSAAHRGDPVAPLNLEPVIAELREDIKDPRFLPNLCRTLLVDNPHRVRLTLTPDPELAEKTQAKERSKLDAIRAELTDDELQLIVEQAKALNDRQNQEDDPGCLPKVGLADVPAEITSPEAQPRLESPPFGDCPVNSYAAGTNGLVYQEILCQLPAVTEDELGLLPLLSHVWTELGVGDKSYLDVQQWQSAVSGGLQGAFRVQSMPDDQFKTRGMMSLNGRALKRNQNQLCELMQSTLQDLRFDEPSRVRELIAHARASSENSVVGSGHTLAMGAAAQFCSPAATLSYKTSGLQGIHNLKLLDQSLESERELASLMERMHALHQKIMGTPRELLVIGEQRELAAYQTNMQQMQTAAVEDSVGLSLPFEAGRTANELWVANAQVNFCARVFPTVPTLHADAPALTVLGGFMRNSFLHRVIREQGGAYGGGASQDNHNGSFRFFSYRDPRMEETLSDFDRAKDWMLNGHHDERLREEAVLGVIAALDKPGSPAGEARRAFHGELFGRTREVRQEFRERVLQVQTADLKRVTETYLRSDRANVAVVTGNQGQAKAAELGLEVKKL